MSFRSKPRLAVLLSLQARSLTHPRKHALYAPSRPKPYRHNKSKQLPREIDLEGSGTVGQGEFVKGLTARDLNRKQHRQLEVGCSWAW